MTDLDLAGRRVLVLGVIDGDKTIDLTSDAKFVTDAVCVEMVPMVTSDQKQQGPLKSTSRRPVNRPSSR